ncbi:glutaredoxin family protein [Candidatus Saccharibacteria bacterium]|nr:glutaredoxin family protein [Candidatus Saccharibacteria bacterium]
MKTVTVYSKNACASCNMVKKWLTLKQVAYTEINTDEKPDVLPEVMRISGAATMPVIIVEDESGEKAVSVGYNPSRLAGIVA